MASANDIKSTLIMITLTGLSVLVIRLLIWSNTFHSGLLYIALPFSLSLALYYYTPLTDGGTWKKRFWNNLRSNMIIMFSVSLVLMEGYVCVIMFMPIFFLFSLIAFIADYFRQRSKQGSLNVFVVPSIALLLSLEGISEGTSFNRYNEVTVSQIIQSDIDTIKEKLSHPFVFSGERHWILWVFPMPEVIEAGSLTQGDTHRLKFVYNRWISTNTHVGYLDITLDEVKERSIKTSIKDSSYISNYMTLHGTELHLDPIDLSNTLVRLTIKFDRTLDPIWYFEPLERFAVRKSAQFLLTELLHE